MNQLLSEQWAPRLLAVLRIVGVLNFMTHGTQRLFNFPPPATPHPWPAFLMAAAVIEVVGGTLVLIGLWTRPAAFILCGEMAVAYFMTHAPRNFWPILNGGEITVLYCFFFLYLVAEGPGAWSVDSTRKPR